MILGDAEGFVHLIDKTFVKTQFQAYDVRVHLMQHLKRDSGKVLITVGEESSGGGVIKLWNLDAPKSVNKDGVPGALSDPYLEEARG